MLTVRRWLMSRKHREVADFIGEKVEYLFRHVLHPLGREYTVEEVAPALGQPAAYVSKLRRGHVANSGAEVLGALSNFFSVDIGYCFRVATYFDEHDPHYPYASRPLREVTPEEVAFVAGVLAQVQD